MADFASINQRKSYGQQQSLSRSNQQPFNANYGQAARGRPGSVSGTGGGMVILSRSKTSQKASGSKLSVPPPLNLPSLRKEHERFDVSGSGGGTGTGAGPSRPTSAGVGWSKPAPVALQDKDGSVRGNLVEQIVDSDNNINHGSYMSSSARSAAHAGHVSGSTKAFSSSVEKASVLFGEDFPSLHAALPVPSGTGPKQKDGLVQKQKQAVGEDSSYVTRDGSRTSALMDMHSQVQSLRQTDRNGSMESSTETHGLGKSPVYDQSRKSEEYFPGPLPLVRLNPRSDWADDERDTRHGLPDRGRDTGFPKGDDFWDRDFDLPRASVLPTKHVYKQYEKQGLRDNESGKCISSAVLKVDPESRNVRTPSREGRENNNWRSTSYLKGQEISSDRNGPVGAGGSGFNKDTWKDARYTPPHAGDADHYRGVVGNKDSTSGWKDRYSKSEPFNGRVSERNTRDRYSIEQSSRNRGDTSLNTTKSSFTSRGKMAYMPDHIQDKSAFSKGDRVVVEDGFHKEFGSSSFDDMDPFYGGWPGLIKRKKDMKSTDFVDPVRESFEAELERVQRMQELERQRLIDEQERAMEEARREEEERQRLIREEEERQRRLEEEAREAAWREEQERLEATQRAEEQRIAREEEKRRVFMEEERRKQAAKQKLLELEAKMAKRQTGSSKAESSNDSVAVDEKLPSLAIDKDSSSTVGFDNWEESERMVERITTFPESSSSSNRDFEIGMKPYFGREGSSIPDRGKSINSWRRDVFGNGTGSSSSLQEQDMGHYSPRGDAFVGGRVVPRKEFNGGARSRGYLRGDVQEHYMDEFGHHRDQRWNFPADADINHKNPEFDYEFGDNFAEKYGDGRAQGRNQGNHRHVYPNAESDEFYSYGRSRYAMRQPRVLPPPSLASAHRSPFGGLDEHPSPSTFLANSHYHHTTRSESSRRMGYYGSYEDGFETSDPLGVRQENPESENRRRNEEVTPRCDSQSSLSVTSPPNSPPHLSNDELDESGSSPVISPEVHGKVQITRNESSDSTIARIDTMLNAPSCASVEVDNWTVEDHDTLLQQEEYDEHGGSYQEEYEVREGEDENLDINQEFEDLHLEERESSDTVDNLVLGFDDGIQVQLSSVDFQKDSRREERDFGVSDASEHIVEDHGSLKHVEGDVQILHPMDGSQITVDTPCGTTVHESDKAILDPLQPTTDLPIYIDVSSNYGLSAQPTASPVTEAICSTQPTTASSSSRADLPVRLQFGLFSGPSLIPSPVPAIQIGSIQMPLHLHPPVGPSLTTHVHQPQTPIFQFGQLTYTSPMSQGILPMPSISVPFVQPNVQAHYVQPAQDTTCQTAMQKEVKSHSKFFSGSSHQSHDSFPVNNIVEDGAPVKTQDAELAQVAGGKASVGFSSKDKHKGQIGEPIQPPNQFVSGAKKFGGVRNPGATTNNRGRRYAYAIKSSNMGTNFPANASSQDSGGFQRRPRRFVQRTEFRVRENGDKRHYSGNVSTNNSRLDEQSNYNGRNHEVFERSVSRQGNMRRKLLKRNDLDNLVSANSNFKGINPGNKKDMENGLHASTRTDILSHSMDEKLKRNMSEEDFGAPLQSGVVRVFSQPGIEAPSDEDDFIQVRSKRQMLNDRRERRQKEIKAKYRDTKPSKKTRASKQSTAASTSAVKTSVAVTAAAPKVLDVASEGHGMPNREVTAGMLLVTSQPLPPIGAPSKNSDPQTEAKSQANKSSPTSRSSIVSPGGSNVVSSAISEINNNLVDVSSSLTSWGDTQTTQPVMSLTQTQLEEAMKPVCFDTHIASIGGHSSTISEATPSSSLMTKDKSFSSSVSPINSLLAGEKIQFGAVTSTTILPLSSHPALHGIGVPGSIPTDMQILQKVSTTESGIFFESDKNNSSSLHDCEAEAEAAASAVAVAAIGGDETVGSRIGSVSVSDAKDFDGEVYENSAVMAADQQLSNKSRGEDSLTVSLPADLSVETPTISMWQSLPSPQSSTSQVLSHFPGGPPSHFPFYEVNPMLGRPVFALQHEAPTGNQSQPQTDTPSISGPFSSWQHSAVDSFYGPPAGYPGPFISSPGGISGVQGSPHMVVYNHFAPVGQFGQVGLSFMGTTYIPTGKQPDWKHNPTSSAISIGEAEINSRNMASSQHSNLNLASTIQHLSPGSPLMPMASPLPMFDVSPFQSQEVSTQAHWSSVSASNLSSVPASRALHQQVDGILPSQFGLGRPAGQPLNVNKFLDTETSVSRNHPSFSMEEGASATKFTDQLGLVDSSLPNATGTSTQSSSPNATAVDVGKRDGIRNVAGNNKPNVTGNNKLNASRPQSGLQHRSASAQHGHTAGYTYQRGAGMSQRNASGSEWSHRRMGYNSKNQSHGAEKGFTAAKVKQIYVAKQTMSGAPSAG